MLPQEYSNPSVGCSPVVCSRYSSKMYMCLPQQPWLTTCDTEPHSRMRGYQCHFWNWTSSSNWVWMLSTLTCKFSNECQFLLQLPESMPQHGSGKHDQRWRYFTILVDNDWIITSIIILTKGICRMIKLDSLPPGCIADARHWLPSFDIPWIRFGPCTLPSSRSAIGNRFIVRQKCIKEFQMLCVGFKVVQIILLLYVVPGWLNSMGFSHIDLFMSLALLWVCNIQCGPLHQHTSFKISFVHTSKPTNQMLFAEVRCSSISLLSTHVGLQLMQMQRVAMNYLPSPIRVHLIIAIFSICSPSRVCPLQLQDGWYQSDNIDGDCECHRPLIAVQTPPAVEIDTATAADCSLQLMFAVDG